MAQRVINVGSAPGANDGETIRNGFIKVNDNDAELYGEIVRLDERINDIQITGGSGTVVSVTVDGGTGLTVTNPTINTSGTIEIDVDVPTMKSLLDIDDLESGKQPLSVVLTNTTASFTIADETKLDTVEEGATANDTDENLKARANHTGTQAISTVTGLQEILDEKLDRGTTVPLVRGTLQEYLTAAEGYLYFDAATMAEARAMVDKGNDSGDFEFDGTDGFNQFVTATDDLNLVRAIDMPWVDRYWLRILGGKSPSCKISFGTGIQVPVDLPDEGTSGDAGKVILAEDKTLILGIAKYDMGGVSYTEIISAETLEAPAPVAAFLQPGSHTVTPAVGTGSAVFEANHVVGGNPVPDIDYKWFYNGVEISGQIAKQYTSSGLEGEYTSEITIDNGVGSPVVSTATARIGAAIPFRVAEYTIWTDDPEVNNITLATEDYVPAVGDFVIYAAAQQNTVDTNLPTDFVRKDTSIPRQNGTTLAGDNFRMEFGTHVLTADDITAGQILGVTTRADSMASISIWRGVGSFFLETNDVVRGSATPATSNSVALQRATATGAARAINFTGSGTYFLHARAATIDGWRAGDQATATGFTNNARYGLRIFDKQVGAGQLPAQTIAAAGAPTANASWNNVTGFLYGVP